VHGREKGKMKIKNYTCLVATKTRKEKSKYNLSMKEGSLFCFVVRRSTK
jgi:hypothetical protein